MRILYLSKVLVFAYTDSMKVTVFLLLTWLVSGSALFGAVSQPILVQSSAPGDDLHWQVAHTRVVSLPVVWPKRADSAVLTVVDANSTTNRITVESGASSVSCALFPDGALERDAVCQLRLEFLKGDAVHTTETATLVVLRSVFGTSPIFTRDSTPKWEVIPDVPRLIPYFGGETQPAALTLRAGETILDSPSIGASGWYSLPDPLGTGTYTLSVTDEDDTELLSATLRESENGTVISIL